MELGILGPFEVRDGSGADVALPAGRERALLAVLALRRGEVVSVDALVDALWGEQPPSTAAKAVQGYVSHLRRLLADAVDDGVLVTRPPGYLLRVDRIDVDAVRFESLAAEAWRTLQDDAAGALATFDEALALWRGPALAEFAYADFAQREIHRLEELRLETIEGRFESMLRLGRHGAVVAELEACVDEHPHRERLRGQLMLALYRAGRQAEALEVYRAGRRRLADELGLEPGTELQRLERAILAQDPALDLSDDHGRHHSRSPPGTTRPPRAESVVPRVLAGLVLAAVLIGAATAGYLLVRDEAPASVAVVPPALIAVDPATNRVVASIPVGSRPVTVAAGAGAIWVGDARDGTVTQVDPETKTAVKTIGVGAPVVDLATGAGGVWAATGGFGEVVRIEPELGVVADRIPLGDPDDPVVPSATAIGVGDGRVWVAVGNVNGLARIDPSSGATVAAIEVGRASVLQVAVGDGAVWATTIASRAKRIEASSARETAEFYAGTWVDPIALGGNAVWIGGESGQLWKVDPLTGTALVTSRPIAQIGGIAVGENAVWVTSYARDGLVRVSAETGEVETRIPTGGPAEDAVVHRGLVWVPVQRAS